MEFEQILYEVDDHVLTITLNRPDRLNAFTATMGRELIEALAAALAADDEARAAFEKLAYTHRKEFARWVDEAKRDDTRERRVAKTLEMLRRGETRS